MLKKIKQWSILLACTFFLSQAVVANEQWEELNDGAVTYYESGNYKDALVLIEKALSYARKELGEQHPNTLTIMNNLATLYHNQGRNEQAEPLYVETLALRKQVLGDQHPDTLSSMDNLARLYYSEGRYD